MILDHPCMLGHVGGDLGRHRRPRVLVVGPSVTAVLVRVGDMDRRGKIHVEGLRLGEREGIGRRQAPAGVRLRDIEKNGRVLGQDPLRSHQSGDTPLGVDRQEVRPGLLAAFEIDMPRLEIGAGVMKQDMRRVGA